ncbi:MAG TPA: hypothetical protein VJG65_04155 [Patescibacteria group bacterium]|nr:hypothetical protein [Patescibacteria group bacterium]
MDSETQNQPTSQEKNPTEIKKRKWPKGKIIVLIIALIIVWLFAVQIMAADRYQAVVKVAGGENQLGINPLSDKLDFGELSRDNGASRFVTLSAKGECRFCLSGGEKFIMIWQFGEISDLIKISKNNFVLKPNEDQRIEFSLYVPVSAQEREYRGQVWVFKLPKLF